MRIVSPAGPSGWPSSVCRPAGLGRGAPLVGDKLQHFWQQFAATGIEEYAAKLAPYASTVTGVFLSKAGNFGLLFLQFLLTVAIAAVMYAGGESAADWMKRFGRRLGGERGAGAVVLASQAIRGLPWGWW